MHQSVKKRKRSDSLLRHTKRFKNRFGNLDVHIEKLNSLVGMEAVKKSVLGQIKFLLCNDGKTDQHFLHTVITGPPGCGKTTLARMLFDLWSSMSVFSEGSSFSVLHRSDLVASYMGQTAAKTRKVLNKHKGGCIFIDEFYTLVNSDTDSYGSEALGELNTFMSENPDTIIIAAGYKAEIEKVFEVQPGLKRRFTWSFDIPKYTPKQIYQIFCIQLSNYGWTVDENVEEIFKKENMIFSGGDTLNIALKSKIEYAKRHWMTGGNKHLLYSDVENAMKNHKQKNKHIMHMYI
jgi:SpoVK/Ycf46/Vps4 family AAA+-type ATPase